MSFTFNTSICFDKLLNKLFNFAFIFYMYDKCHF